MLDKLLELLKDNSFDNVEPEKREEIINKLAEGKSLPEIMEFFKTNGVSLENLQISSNTDLTKGINFNNTGISTNENFPNCDISDLKDPFPLPKFDNKGKTDNNTK